MTEARRVRVAADEDGLRLDRWFKRRFPDLSFGHLQKLLRTGQVRVDGARAKTGQRLEAGQEVRLPPGLEPAGAGETAPRGPRPVAARDAEDLARRVLYRDGDVIALDKPAGLAVQGGSKTTRHLDGMLDALRFGAGERPRLVHRLDKDTSGVLLLARHAAAAADLTRAFREGGVRKLYWAAVAGVLSPREGLIDLPLAKVPGPRGEQVGVERGEGRRAVTAFRTVEAAGRRVSWLALEPRTGRTHQLRVHCAAAGAPILGDGKYGGAAAFMADAGLSPRLHLHARALCLPRPGGRVLEVRAPLPPHMAESWGFFGFTLDAEADLFLDGD
ncbi:MAG: RluA family pseudouridine synthase [Hyphomicrobiales bacterium]|nr:RluA family pseudouridine synthase [Hyphomicrobiales bacterium]MCP5373933.1 RluA family pseudouridine synthase [Hyphomicrobiales bacterium]